MEHYEPAYHNRLVDVKLPSSFASAPIAVNGTVSAISCCPLPLVLSAKTEHAMKGTIESLLDFIKTPSEYESGDSDWNMVDLAWTLLCKKSAMSIRRVIVPTGGLTLSPHDRMAACDALVAALKDGTSSVQDNDSDTTNSNVKPCVLGIFTGQGAQWPGMMKELTSRMPFVRAIVKELDTSLQALPAEYRPSWTLQECFALEPEDVLLEERLGRASFSMPLCTAVQIVLVRLLAAARVKLAAAVGHSGGETACALAAGLISPSQAIRIAYLRGFVAARHAVSPRGEGIPGAMMAAHVPYDDAQELCGLREFKGRVCVAAVNAPSGVTFSGDADAIHHIQGILEDENKWSRVLRVEKAYHSPHVLPCASPYIDALVASDCGLADDSDSSYRIASAWYSSADEGNKLMSKNDVTAEYWAHNFVSPVLFMQAVEKAVKEHEARPFGAAVEVGCHPALRSPCVATMDKLAGQKQKHKSKMPYVGCLQRGGHDMDAFAGCLGLLWEQFGESGFDPNSFIATTTGFLPGPGSGKIRSLANILPRYSWEHLREYRSDSRTKNAILRSGTSPHLLLGKQMATTSNTIFQWRNVVRPLDHGWLEGHVLQGQTVFPAAGYVTMAMEAVIEVFGNRNRHIQLIEILDLDIGKAISFGDETSLAELILTAKMISEPDFESETDTTTATLSFNIDSCLPRESKLSTSAAGRLVVTFSSDDSDLVSVLPPAQEEHPHMHDISINSFYRELQDLDYTYGAQYRGIQAIRRGDGKASGTMSYPVLEDRLRQPRHRLVLHPASMDLALQALFSSYSSPGDQRLRCMYLPVCIKRVALVPSLCQAAFDQTDKVEFNAVVTYDKGDYLSGSAQAFWETNSESGDGSVRRDVLYEVEQLVLRPLTPPSASDDHLPFKKTVWGPFSLESVVENPEWRATDADREVMGAIERVVLWFVRDFVRNQLTSDDRRQFALHHQLYIDWCEHILADAPTANPWYDASWENDTITQVKQLCARFSYHPHMRMVERVHANMLSSFRDVGSNPFGFMDDDGLLTQFYSSTTTFGPQLLYLQEIISKIAHRYQCMDILEVGAGTGGATRCILKTPQLGFNSFTFSDISPSFFEAARAEFGLDSRMDFRVLNLCQPPEQQGFTPNSYDLIIAHNVLHATPSLDQTMLNVRSLLKPGGYVAILEGTQKEVNRYNFIFGLFPDWWAGYDEGRIWGPFVTVKEWDAVLKRTGFSGIETRTSEQDSLLFPTSVFTARAIGIERLYNPLSAPLEDNVSYSPIVIIGGESLKTSSIVDEMRVILPHRQLRSIRGFTDLLGPETSWIEDQSTFIVLSDIDEDEELFSAFDEDMFLSVKQLCSKAGRILWLTENAWVDHPLHAMTIGFVRTLRLEYEDVPMQVLDVDVIEELPIKFLTEQLLSLESAPGTAAFQAVENMTWTWEPEVYWSEKRAWLPRIKTDMVRNNRVNSERRAIMTTANPAQTAVSLRGPDRSLHLEPVSEPVPGVDMDAGLVTIHVHYSMTKAIRVGTLGFFHLVQGVVAKSGEEVVALAASNASIVFVPVRRVFTSSATTHKDSEGHAKRLLYSVSESLLAHAILSDTTSCIAPGASVLVLEPPDFCQKALAKAANGRHVRLYFATTAQKRGRGRGRGEDAGESEVPWVRLHRHDTEDGLKHKLPENLVALYIFSATDSSATGTATTATGADVRQRLLSCLPPGCSVWHAARHLMQADAAPMASAIEQDHETAQLKLVEQAITAAAEATSAVPTVHCHTVAADQVKIIQGKDDLAMVDWRASGELAVRVRPIDAGKLFASDKTFLLAGLGGSLGRALARWMVTRGARHIVLSSRRPEALDARWADELKKTYGSHVNITTLPMDVTIEAAVDEGLARIRQTMPSIGGIALGTMILHDTPFKNMELGEWQSVVKAKAEGARLLHERFSDPAHNLDFFVMFSSAVKVTGNPGQANYTAANAYLQGLTQHRRVNGLTGSTIDVGALFGAGYLAKSQREEEYLQFRYRADSLSVPELYALFAEAVVSGRCGAKSSTSRSLADTSEIEITTGIPEFDRTRKGFRVKYFYDPRFGGLRIPETREQRGGGDKTSSSRANKIPVKEQLQKAATMDEVRQAIVDGLSDKLGSTLQLPADKSSHVNATVPLIDQGVDSLVAMAVTKWFSKELSLTVPVLKVLSGASVADLAEDAATRLPPPVIPLIKTAAHEVTEPAQNGDKEHKIQQNGTNHHPDHDQHENRQQHNAILRQEQLSIAQEDSWRLQQAFGENVSNTTVGMFMQGPIDLERLARAWESSLRRYEIFRTAFTEAQPRPSGPSGGVELPKQTIMSALVTQIRLFPVADRGAAEEELNKLASTHHYDVAAGETLLVVIYYWPGDGSQFLLVFGYHRLVGDGSTTENLFGEVGQLYNGTKLPPPLQYGPLAAQQRADLEGGKLDAHVQYWHKLYNTPRPPPVLPALHLPQALAHVHAHAQRPALPLTADALALGQHEASGRVPPLVGFRIRERSRQYKATAMHFYLTAYHILLARLTQTADMTIGLADTGRSTADQLAAMGPFANTLPVRMPAHVAGATFIEALTRTRDRVRQAMPHALVPLPALSAPEEATHNSMFQAVFDYRQGATESGRIGGASIVETVVRRNGVGPQHHVLLEVSDDPTRVPLVNVKLPAALYGPADPGVFVDAYLSLLALFSSNAALKVAEGDLGFDVDV